MTSPPTNRELKIIYVNILVLAITILIAYAKWNAMYVQWQETDLKLQSLTEKCADCLEYK